MLRVRQVNLVLCLGWVRTNTIHPVEITLFVCCIHSAVLFTSSIIYFTAEPVDWESVCCLVCWPYNILRAMNCNFLPIKTEATHMCCCPEVNPICCGEPDEEIVEEVTVEAPPPYPGTPENVFAPDAALYTPPADGGHPFAPEASVHM